MKTRTFEEELEARLWRKLRQDEDEDEDDDDDEDEYETDSDDSSDEEDFEECQLCCEGAVAVSNFLFKCSDVS